MFGSSFNVSLLLAVCPSVISPDAVCIPLLSFPHFLPSISQSFLRLNAVLAIISPSLSDNIALHFVFSTVTFRHVFWVSSIVFPTYCRRFPHSYHPLVFAFLHSHPQGFQSISQSRPPVFLVFSSGISLSVVRVFSILSPYVVCVFFNHVRCCLEFSQFFPPALVESPPLLLPNVVSFFLGVIPHCCLGCPIMSPNAV